MQTAYYLNTSYTSDTDDSRPGGLPRPGTLEHTVTLGLFRLQQGLNQAALKLQEGPESLLQEGYSLLTGQTVATDKIGQAADTAPSVSYSTLTNVNPTSVALGVLATGEAFSFFSPDVRNLSFNSFQRPLSRR